MGKVGAAVAIAVVALTSPLFVGGARAYWQGTHAPPSLETAVMNCQDAAAGVGTLHIDGTSTHGTTRTITGTIHVEIVRRHYTLEYTIRGYFGGDVSVDADFTRTYSCTVERGSSTPVRTIGGGPYYEADDGPYYTRN